MVCSAFSPLPVFFFSSRRRHTRSLCDWSSDVCSSDLFLHNDVATIEVMREKLEKLLPEARIAVAHGQMRERDLERVMRSEEHTSELQSHSDLVCRLLLEKKKKSKQR